MLPDPRQQTFQNVITSLIESSKSDHWRAVCFRGLPVEHEVLSLYRTNAYMYRDAPPVKEICPRDFDDWTTRYWWAWSHRNNQFEEVVELSSLALLSGPQASGLIHLHQYRQAGLLFPDGSIHPVLADRLGLDIETGMSQKMAQKAIYDREWKKKKP